jgi:hypothetical protein
LDISICAALRLPGKLDEIRVARRVRGESISTRNFDKRTEPGERNRETTRRRFNRASNARSRADQRTMNDHRHFTARLHCPSSVAKTTGSILFFFIAISSLAHAAVVYQENFDIDHTGDWSVNSGPGTHQADFFFDYSSVGIPAAPNSAGTTRGLKLQANLSGDTFAGFSVSPLEKSFEGDYQLRFDMWLNFNGPAPDGGPGSTQVTGAGIGTSGFEPQYAGPAVHSLFFGATGDGGSSADYRAYSSAASVSYQDQDLVYAAAGTGNRNNTHPYYAGFGNLPAPAEQVALFPQQTGATAPGALGFAWHDVTIDKLGDTATFNIDGVRIATIDLTTVTFGGTNILFTQFDINATSSTDPNASALLFGLIDNVRVSELFIPEPSVGMLAIAAVGCGLLRRHRRSSCAPDAVLAASEKKCGVR